MIAVVTGSSGFIGSHLVEALIEQGFHVRCLDNRSPANSSLHDPRVEHYTIDCTELRSLVETGALEGADYLFHLAGGTKAVNLEEFRKWNVLPTRNLLQVLAERRIRLKRFVYVSSQAAASPAQALDRPTTEATPPEPVEDYGKSKLEAERVVEEYASFIPFTILRPCSVYGPRDVDFLNIFKQISNHLSVYPGYRDNVISIIFITDLVDGVLQAMRAKGAEGKTYFLCADEPASLCDIHRAIANAEEKNVIELSIPQRIVDLVCKAGDVYSKLTGRYSIVNSQKAALSRPPYWICSAERAKKDFGFETRVSLSEGLRITYRWYLENGWLKSS